MGVPYNGDSIYNQGTMILKIVDSKDTDLGVDKPVYAIHIAADFVQFIPQKTPLKPISPHKKIHQFLLKFYIKKFWKE